MSSILLNNQLCQFKDDRIRGDCGSCITHNLRNLQYQPDSETGNCPYRDDCVAYLFALFFPESRKFLLYARQIEIRGVDIDNPYYNYIISFTVPDIDNVTVVDYDAVEHRIYWSDVRTQTIKRAFINGTGVETVVSAGKNN